MELPADTIDFAHRMFDAARNGDTPILVQAVDAGLPPNLTNDSGSSCRIHPHLINKIDSAPGNTLLMLAAYSGHHELVANLIDRGADPNRLNDRGQSPIAGAVFKGFTDVVRVLATHGADPRTGQPNAIHTARMFGRTDLLGLLGAREGEGMDIPPGVGIFPGAHAH